MWQRSCQALSAMVTNAATVQRDLPKVLSRLRAVAPALEASCISPGRYPESEGRATVMLGRERSERNVEIWDAAYEDAFARCHGDVPAIS